MRLAVIEGKWTRRRNISVRGMFDLLSDLVSGTPHDYHYEMFNNGAAFREIYTRIAATPGIHNIYIAAHGEENGIFGSNGELVSRTILRNTIREADGKLESLYFGTCLCGNRDMMEDMLAAGTRLRWVAGYERSVDFIESTALDWIFWNAYSATFSDGTALERIEATADYMQANAAGLVKRLGFRVSAWDGGYRELI